MIRFRPLFASLALLFISFLVLPKVVFGQMPTNNFCTNCNGNGSACNYPAVSSNPALEAVCGQMKIVFILDESGSIANSGATGTVRTAVMGFLNALNGTQVQVAVIEFADCSRLVTNYQEVNSTFITSMNNYLYGTGGGYNGQNYSPSGGTNWMDAMYRAHYLSDADLIVFFTDGQPTGYTAPANLPSSLTSTANCSVEYCSSGSTTEPPEIVNPMKISNYIKENYGTHVFMVGVGGVTQLNLERMSGNVQWVNGVNTIANADYALGNFSDLAASLQQFAYDLCGTEMTLSVSSTTDTICLGGITTLIYEVTNNGPDNPALNLVVTDTLIGSFTGLSCFSNCGSVCIGSACGGGSPATRFRWTIGTLNVGQTATMSLQVQATAGGIYPQTAWAITSNSEPEPANYTIHINAATLIAGQVTPIAATGCNTNDGILQVGVSLSGGMSFPLYIDYTYQGNVYTAGPYFAGDIVSGKINITGLAPGSYTDITLIDNNNCQDNLSGPFVIGGPLPVVATITAQESTICDGGSASLSAQLTGGSGSTTYNWQYLSGSTWTNTGAPSQNTFTSGPLTIGSHQFRLIVTQSSGCIDTSNVQTITVVADPQVNVTGTDGGQICAGGTVLLTANVTGGTGTTSYQWQFNNSGTWTNVGYNQNSYTTPVLNTPGSYSYRVIINQNSGCTVQSAPFNVVVSSDPAVTISAVEDSICNLGVAVLTANVTGGAGASNYQWQQLIGATWTNVGTNTNQYTTSVLTPGNYQFRVVVTQNAGCSTTSAAYSISVVNDPGITVEGSDGGQICPGGSVTLSANVSGGAGSSTFQWQFFDGFSWQNVGGNQNTYTTPVLNTPGNYQYIVHVTQNNGCSSQSVPFVVTVSGSASVAASAAQSTICNGGSAMLSANVSGGAGTPAFQWQQFISGSWQNISGATTNPYTTAALTPGNYQYRVIVTQNAGCESLSNNVDISVVGDPTVDVSGTDNGQICVGGSVLLTANVTGGAGTTTYQWQQLVSGNWTNVGANQSTYNPGSLGSVGTYSYRVQISQNSGCDAQSVPFQVTVVADPVITASAEQTTICNGGSAVLSANVSGGTGTTNFQWQQFISGSWQNIGGANTNPYTTGPLSTGSHQFRVMVTQNAGCESSSNGVTITVVADPNVSVSGSDNGQICVGGTVTMTANVTGGAGTTNYQWQFNNSGTWTNVGTNQNTYTTAVLNTVGNYQYRVMISQNSGCEATSVPFAVNVVADPTVTASAQQSTICDGGAAVLTANVSGGAGTAGFQWQQFISGSWQNIGGANTNPYTTAALTPGNYQYRVVVTQNAGCQASSDGVTITVVNDPTVDVTGTDGGQICTGGSVLLTANVTGGAGNTNYQWQQLIGATWTNVGTNQSTYNTGTLGSVGNFQYRVLVTQNSGCSAQSVPFVVSVVADPTITASAEQTTICSGGSAVLTANVSGGAGTASFQWQRFISGSWQNIGGANTNPYITDPLSTGSHQFRVVVTQNAGCETSSNGVTITVLDGPNVNVSGSDNGQICIGGSVLLTANVSGGAGAITYQWQFNNSGTWTNVGANQNTYTTPVLNTVGNYQYRVLVSQNSGCEAASVPFVVNVAADPTVTASAAQSTICDGGAAQLTANVTGGAGTASFQWQQFISGSWQNIGGANTNPYTTAALTPGSYQYRVVVTQNAGCETSSDGVTITVVNDPTVEVTGTDGGQICIGGSVLMTANVTGGAGTTSYQWQQLIGATWTNVGTNQPTHSTGTLNAMGTYQFRVMITQNSGCSAQSVPFAVSVVADPSITATAEQTSICDGGSAVLTANVSGGAGTASFQWQQLIGATWTNIGGANTNPYTTSALSTGSHQFRVVVTQNAGCENSSNGVTITVVSDPNVSVSGSDNGQICVGGTVTMTANVTGGAGTTTYQWQQMISGNWTNVGTNQNSYTTPVLNTVGNYQYRVQVSQNSGCEATSVPFAVNVVADPTVSASAEQTTICDGGSAVLTANVSGGAGIANFQWQQFISGSWQNIGGANTNPYTTAALTTGSYQYRVVVTQNAGCQTSSDGVTITVVNDPTVEVTGTDGGQICTGGSVLLTANVTGGAGTTNYQWQQLIGATWANVGMNQSTYHTGTLGSVGNFQYRVLVTQNSGCSAQSVPFVVSVVADPTIFASAEQTTICNGGSAVLTANVTGGAGTASFQWQRFISGSWQNIGGANTNPYITDALSTGSHQFRVVVTQNAGCESSSNGVTISVLDGPAADISGSDNGQICAGGTVLLTANVTGGAGTPNFQWQFNSGGTWTNVGADQNTYTTPVLNTPGSYSYRVLVSQNSGCEDTSSVFVVTVLSNPSAGLGADQFICQGETTTLTVVPSGGVGPYTYLWSTGETTFSINVTPATTTTYYVTVYDAQGCSNSTTEDVVVTVYPTPIANAGSDQTICYSKSATLQVMSSGGTGSHTYLWSTNETTAQITVSPLDTTLYAVTVTDVNGCTAVDFVQVNVEPCLANISGYVRDDVGNPVPGATLHLYADTNDDDLPDGPIVAITSIDGETGNYIFEDIYPGRYVIVQVQPANYDDVSDYDHSTGPLDMDGNDSALGPNNRIPVTLEPYESDTDNNFIEDPHIGHITGFVLTDYSEPIAGVQVQLYFDHNQDGNPDGGVVATATTDASGAYAFVELQPGNYLVTQTQPANYFDVSDYDHSIGPDDLDGDDSALGPNNKIQVILLAGEIDADNNFIENAWPGTICGFVRDDIGNPISNVTLQLFTDPNGDGNHIPDGVLVATATTDGETGLYCFEDIEQGQYVIFQIQPNHYDSVSDYDHSTDASDPDGDDSAAGPNNRIPVILLPAEADMDNNFIEDPHQGHITGQVREDIGGGIAGVTIELWNDGNGDGQPDAGGLVGSVVTNASGNYAFMNAEPGRYVLKQIQPNGFTDYTDYDRSINPNDLDGDDSALGPNNLIPVILEPGETDADNDFEESALPGLICGTVKDDVGNPIANIVLQLFTDPNGDGNPGDGSMIASTTTDGETGSYCFEDVYHGDYVVVQIHPANYESVSDYDHSTDASDPDGNDSALGPNNWIPVTLLASEADMDNNFIEDPHQGHITGQVREDIGAAIAGVTIELWNDGNGDGQPDAGGFVGSQVTDAGGNYAFMNAEPGRYVLKQIQPNGFTDYTDYDRSINPNDLDGDDSALGPNNLIPVILEPGETDADNDFEESALPGLICGTVKDDVDNPIANIVLQLFTDPNGDGNPGDGVLYASTTTDGETGSYCFEDVYHGDYVVVQIHPANYESVSDYDHSTDASDPDGNDSALGPNNWIPVTLLASEADMDNNFIEDPHQGHITGQVREDIGAAIAGVTIELWNDGNGDGQPDAGGFVGSQVTDAGGNYAFMNAEPGRYVLKQIQPNGFADYTDYDRSINPNDLDGDDSALGPNNLIPVILEPGETDADNDFEESALPGLICGTVKDDVGNPIANIVLQLFTDPNGDGNPGDGSMIASTTTDGETGSYCFEDVYHGDYVVVQVHPANYESVSDYDHSTDASDPDGNDSALGPNNWIPVTLLASEADMDNNFIEDPHQGHITGQVREDIGAAIAGVTIELWNDGNGDGQPDAGGFVGSQVTDAGGNYAFMNAEPGRYVLKQIQPNGFADYTDYDRSINPNDLDGDDSALGPNNLIPVILEPGETDADNDFEESALPGLICGTVKDDVGNPIANIVLQLFTDPNGDGNPGDGSMIASTTTDGETGSYCFEDVYHGDYVVVQIHPANYESVSDYDHSTDASDPDGNDSALGPNNWIPVTLLASEADMDNNFIEDPHQGHITGRVREDIGVAIAGVTIELWNDGNGDGQPDAGGFVGSQVTDAGGNYAFMNAEPGRYVLKQIQPNGFADYTDYDRSVNPNDLDGDDSALGPNNLIPVILEPGETDADNDFEESALPGAICGTVQDINGNPIPNITLQLFTDPNGDGLPADGVLYATTTTDGETGAYCFEDVYHGKYVVVEVHPMNYQSISDYDHSTGASDPDGDDSLLGPNDRIPVVLLPAEADYDNNFIESPNPGTISGRVEEDETGLPISGVMIRLHVDTNGDGSPDGPPIGTTTTNGSGFYEFTGVQIGNYVVRQVQPENYISISDYDHSTGPLDPDGNDSAQGPDEEIPVTIVPGEDDTDNNFIEYPYPSLICGMVTDELGNPLANVELQLYRDTNEDGIPDGPVLFTTTTDGETGSYCYEDIPYGSYVVVEILPGNYQYQTDYDHSTGAFDPDGNDAAAGPNGRIPVTTTPGEADLDNNFTNIACPGLPTVAGDLEIYVCDGHEATITANMPPISGITFSWDFGALATPPTATGPGPHYVTYAWSQANEEEGAQVILTLTKESCPPQSGEVARVFVSQIPDATIDAQTFDLCAFQTRVFKPLAAQIPGAIYTWDFGADATPATATGYGPHTVFYSQTGSKTVSLTVNPNYPVLESCPDTGTMSFNVNSCPGNIAGQVINNAGAPVQGTPVQLWADTNGDGLPDGSAAIASTFTNASGQFAFTQIAGGNYVLMQLLLQGYSYVKDEDVSPDGDIVPNLVIVDGLIPVTVIPATTDAGNNFTITNNQPSINGIVFVDDNMDQTRDLEEGLADVKIVRYLDADIDGLPDAGGVIDSVYTDAYGNFVFASVTPGNYVLVQEQPGAYLSFNDLDITPNGDQAPNLSPTDNIIPVSVVAGEVDGGNYYIEVLGCSLMVLNTDDDGFGSLRNAIACAEVGSTITFAPELEGDTIYITSDALIIDKDLTLACDFSGTPIVIRSETEGLLVIQSGQTVILENLMILSGTSGDPLAIYNMGYLFLDNVHVKPNPDLIINSYYLIRNQGELTVLGATQFFRD